jgi:hypothetical protein
MIRFKFFVESMNNAGAGSSLGTPPALSSKSVKKKKKIKLPDNKHAEVGGMKWER